MGNCSQKDSAVCRTKCRYKECSRTPIFQIITGGGWWKTFNLMAVLKNFGLHVQDYGGL